MQCPTCGSSDVHRSRSRTAIERVWLKRLHVYSFRCSACRARFHRRRVLSHDPRAGQISVAFKILAAVVVAAIVALGVMISLADRQ